MPLFFPPVGLPTEFPDCPGGSDDPFHASHRSNLLPQRPYSLWEVLAGPNNLPLYLANKGSLMSNLTNIALNLEAARYVFIYELKADFSSKGSSRFSP